MAAEARAQDIIWRPQAGPQAALVECSVSEIFYGGARGGGKTDGMIGKNAIKADRYGEQQKGIFFRRELPQLEAAINRCKQIYQPLGWGWQEQKKTFIAPNGATLKFRPLERDAHAEKYQGHDYTDVYFEELTNFPDPKPVNKLRATLRSAAGVPCQFHGTGNPGGPGHQWVKARYIDPGPWNITVEPFTNPFDGTTVHIDRVFIPAKLSDNELLMRSDPMYVARLYQSGSAQLVKAWLEGDWDIVEGAFFDCWSSRNVIRPFEIPDDWTKFRSFDWGSARPFSLGWWALVGDDFVHNREKLRRGAMIRYREWYGMKPGEPNVGLKLTAEKIAEGIKARTTEKVHYSVADPAIFSEDGGPSHAERMARAGVIFTKADNRRVPRAGALGGWDQLRDRIIGTRGIDEQGIISAEGEPMIFCFDTCLDSIRTIPVLQHDENRMEDVDSDMEDHAADEWRYGCMSRPWVRNVKPPTEPDTDAWGKPRRGEQNWKTG